MIPGEIGGEATVFEVFEGVVGDGGFVIGRVPEIMSVDRAVGEPERAVMRMVLLLVSMVFVHGKIPGEVVSGRSDEWVEIGEVVIGAVFGHERVAAKDFQRLTRDLLAKLG